MKGILNIIKPPEMTSHDVVSIVRRKIGIKKVGHTGTLDPNAAGVLPICIGQATKISQYLLEDKKRYRAEMTLGVTTDTQDSYGIITDKKTVNVSTKDIEEALLSFVGDYKQTPPMYSALKINGKKLYELARSGIEVPRKSRWVKIEKINIIKITNKTVLFDVICSKGTYIRTLCDDVGKKLGCGAIMSFLLRTATGKFNISSAITIEEFQSIQHINDIEKILKPIDYPLTHMPRIDLESTYKKAVLNGNKIFSQGLLNTKTLDEEIRVYIDDQFIGIGVIKKDRNDNKYIKFSRLFI